MQNLRKHGEAPHSVAVIHGGPGAAGEMAPVASELSSGWGVLEPLQTAASLTGQVEELKTVLERNGSLPVALVGFSWGAWLSFIVAARYPAMIRKLVLVGSGPYEERYAASIQETRLSRLGEEERIEFESIIRMIDDPAQSITDASLSRLGALASKTDTYDLLTCESRGSGPVGGQGNVFQGVWRDAAELRRNGTLLRLGKKIRCPVVAIHGDYDPHPAEGVQVPLSAVLTNFRFILLRNCGHTPWMEREARAKFYAILREELH